MKKARSNTAETAPKPAQHPRYFYAILISLPFLFFFLLELGLRLFGYGLDTRQWVPATEDKLLLNPDIGRLYFHTVQNIPISNQDVFDKEKKPNAFRVFVLGESSGAGYPYTPIGAFSRWLQKRLELLYPRCTIEVVNLSMTAINSYTLRDLFPGVLEQKPDVVLIYAGHNEYYGALGIGSTETFGANRAFVLLTLYLNKFKTIELLRNTLSTVSKTLSRGTTARQDGTLMSRMAKDQYIEFNSEQFRKGLSQYEGNMRDILAMARSHNIPVVLGTLVNNVKDQKPFISLESGGNLPAQRVFEMAKKESDAKHSHQADSLFRLAKDLDALRFRSSEKMNQLIEQLGKEFACPIVQLDSVFSANSPEGIVGDNLITDHLHPTLDGYHFMARSYFETMRAQRLLPHCDAIQISDRGLDSLTLARFNISRLDLVIANYRIKILKNDWPYIEKKDQKRLSELLAPKDFIEQTAYEFLKDNATWESAHRKAAGWYLQNKNYPAFQRQMDVLISQYPIVVEYYDFAANELLKAEQFDDAYGYLLKRYNVKPDAYSSKWLGIIDLSKGKTANAIRYLAESLKYSSSDPQVWYNISGAYSSSKDYRNAFDAINKCLAIDPSFPKASELKSQLQRAIN